MVTKQPSALAEGFFWYAEKLRFGYEDIAIDPEKALSLYKQAANLGYGLAYLRLGEMYEQAIGTKKDVKQAITSYRTRLARAARDGCT